MRSCPPWRLTRDWMQQRTAEVAASLEGLNAAAMKKDPAEVKAAYDVIKTSVVEFVRIVNTKVPQDLPPLSELK